MRIALKFAYDGKYFSGYARQPQQTTVEEDILDALKEQGIISDSKESCFRTASRTDKGVSALGNVCAFNTLVSPEDILSKLQQQRSDIFVYGACEVPMEFYPRHAQRREYRYYLKSGTLDVDAVLSAAGLFTGEHDFSNFARVEALKNPVRTIDNIIVSIQQDFLVIDFFAPTFLWNQIRRIVSSLEKIGNGCLTLKDVRFALEHPEQKVDYQLAPPEPLLLKNVVYDFSFFFIKGYQKNLHELEQRIVSSL